MKFRFSVGIKNNAVILNYQVKFIFDSSGYLLHRL